MKAAAVAVVAFAFVLAAVGALVPASFADRRVAALTGGEWRVTDTNGTLWNGGGALTDRVGAWRIPLRWRIAPGALLRGELELMIAPASDAGTPQGRIVLTNGSVLLSDVALELPAKAMASLISARAAVVAGGDIVVTTSAFQWSGTSVSGNIAARWPGARLASGAGAVDLGTVDIALAPLGRRLAGRVDNSGGDVRIDGSLIITATTASIEATATPTASAPGPIARVLASLGTSDGQGGVRIRWQTGVP